VETVCEHVTIHGAACAQILPTFMVAKRLVVDKCQMVHVNYGDLSRFSPSCPSADHFEKYLQPSALSFSKQTYTMLSFSFHQHSFLELSQVEITRMLKNG